MATRSHALNQSPPVDDVVVSSELAIPFQELRFRYSRSRGPGGQNVNKVHTRVTVLLDVLENPLFTETQRRRIHERLATRINKDGWLHVSSDVFRTRGANRKLAVARVSELLAWALHENAPRVKTRVPRRAQKRRLHDKANRSDTKRHRRRPGENDA